MRAISQVQWIEFKSSNVWLDIRDDLTIELESIRDELELPSTDEQKVMWLRGRAMAIRHFLQIPDMMMEALEDDARRKTKTKEAEDVQ